MSSYRDAPLRSPEQIMDARRAKHPEYLTRIHGLLDAAEHLANTIVRDHDPFSEVAKSFEALAESLKNVRGGSLLQADKDLKYWYASWEPYGD